MIAYIVAAAALGMPAESGTARGETYTNPVYAADFPDPFVLRHDGRYYAYATQADASGFQLLESTDLVHWTPRRSPFRPPWSRRHYWAPEVVRHDGLFYMTYSALDPETRKHHIAVATAERPEGPFTHRAILVRGDDNRVGVIDATVVFDDGTPYLAYSEETPRRIVIRRLRPDLLGVDGEATELIRPDRAWEHGVTEAPTLWKRGDRWHLFYSGGPFQGRKGGSQYAVGHAVGDSLAGPYTKTPGPILAGDEGRVYGPGHQCLIATPAGETWVLYHAWDDRGEPRYGSNPAGRTLRIDRLEWEGDLPHILGPTTTPRAAPRLGGDDAGEAPQPRRSPATPGPAGRRAAGSNPVEVGQR